MPYLGNTHTSLLTTQSLNITGDADIGGTLEADVITVDGVALAETIADTVGAMVTSNNETGITVTYQDSDNTLDFVIGTLNQNTTGSAATLTTARAIALTGDVSGTANFDGSAGITITTTIADDSHNHTIANVDGLQTALDLKSPLASPTFTGNPIVPTQAASDNTTKVASTAYVTTAIANLADSAPATLNTLNELAAALGDDANFSTTVTNSIATKAPLASPTLTGTPAAPTASASTNTTQIATTEFVTTAVGNVDLSSKASLSGAAFTGASSFVAGFNNPAVTITGGTTLQGQGKIKFTGAGTALDHISMVNDGVSAVFGVDRSAGAGLGVATDAYACVIGTVSASRNVNIITANQKRTTIDTSGNLTQTGNITAYSDERLKENIQTIPNALEKVTSMRGVMFDKKSSGDDYAILNKSSGVIAQELEKIAPELVLDGEYKSVAYGNLVGYLIEAVKELSAKVKELEAK